MPIPITMPALSPTMTEGNLAKWLRAEGDRISPGDVIAEIETDKATMEVEAVDEGVLAKILVGEGSEGVAVNSVIALLLEEGEDEGALESYRAAPAAPAAALPVAADGPAPPPAAPAATNAAPLATTAPAGAGDGGRIKASPLARRMALQADIDLAQIAGSGPHGRIVKADIEAVLGRAPAAVAAPAARAPAPAAARPPAAEVPHTNMRRVIARRLTEAKRDIPHFYMSLDCQVDALLELRKTLNGKAEAAELGHKLSLNDLVIRATALALRKVPEVNVSWTDEVLLKHDTVDLSVAVAVAGGLVTPVIRDADRKGLAEISGEMKELAGRAHEGKLLPEEYQGGTFSISNLGMFGVREFAAVINPPQSAILAVGQALERPVVKDGALATATVMTVTLSVDHRAVDGAVGAGFLAAFRGLVEDPLTMLL